MEQQERPDFTACPMWGQGGRYLYDPATGKRSRIEERPQNLPLAEPEDPATGLRVPDIVGKNNGLPESDYEPDLPSVKGKPRG